MKMKKLLLAIFLCAALAGAQPMLLLTASGGPNLLSWLTVNTAPSTRHDTASFTGWGFRMSATSTKQIVKARVWCWAADGSGGTASTGTYTIGISHTSPTTNFQEDAGATVNMTGCTPGTFVTSTAFSPSFSMTNGVTYHVVVEPNSGVTMGDHSGGSYSSVTAVADTMFSITWDGNNFTDWNSGQQLAGPIDLLYQ